METQQEGFCRVNSKSDCIGVGDHMFLVLIRLRKFLGGCALPSGIHLSLFTGKKKLEEIVLAFQFCFALYSQF